MAAFVYTDYSVTKGDEESLADWSIKHGLIDHQRNAKDLLS